MRIARVIICYLLILLLLFFEEIAAGNRYGSSRKELSFQEFSQKFSVNFSLRNHLEYIGYNLYKLLHNNNSYSNTSKKKIDRIFGNSIKVICFSNFDEDFDADDEEERNKKNRKSRKSKSGSYISGSFFLDLSGCHFNYIYVGNYDNYDNEDDYYVDIEEDEEETTAGTKKYRRRKNNFGGFSLDLSGCYFSTIYNSGDEELEEDEEDDDDGEKGENEEEGEDETSGETTEEGVGDEEQNPSSDGILSPDGVLQAVNIGTNPDGTGTVTGIDALTQGGILIDPNQFPSVAQNTLPYSDPTMMQTGLYDTTGMSDYNAMSQTMSQNYGGSSYVNSGTMMYGNGMYNNGMYNGVYNGGNAYNNGGMYNNGMSDYSQNMGMNTSYYQGFNGTNGLGMSDNSVINGMNEYNAMSDFQNPGQNPGMYQQQGSMYQNFQPGTEYNSGMSDQTMINPNYGGVGSSMGADGNNMMQMQQYPQDLQGMDGMQNMKTQSNMYTDNSTMQDISQDASAQFSSQDELSQRYLTGETNISSDRAVRAQDYPMEQEQETMNTDEMREFSGRESENSAITEINDTRRDTEVMQRSQYPDNTQQSSTTFSREQSSIDGIQREVAPSDIVSRSGEGTSNYRDYGGQFSTSVAQMQASPTSSENSVSSHQEFQTNSDGFSTSFGRQGGNGAIYGNAVSSYIPDTDTETFSAPSTSRRTIFDGSMWSTQPIPSFEWNTTPQEETYDLDGPLRSWEF